MKLLSGMPKGALGGKERMMGATAQGHEGSCVKRLLFFRLGRWQWVKRGNLGKLSSGSQNCGKSGTRVQICNPVLLWGAWRFRRESLRVCGCSRDFSER